MTPDSLRRLIASCPHGEHPWIEFKVDVWDPEMIGQNISAMANGAVYYDRSQGYVIWGVEDGNRAVVGTSFRPSQAKFKGQNLHLWLTSQVSPSHDFQFHEVLLDGEALAVLRVPRAKGALVAWKGQRFLRVGSSTTSLKDKHDTEKQLWVKLNETPYDRRIIADGLTMPALMDALDFKAAAELLGVPPGSPAALTVTRLREAGAVKEIDGAHAISLCGALAFAKKLSHFEDLERKAPRVIVWDDDQKTGTAKEVTGQYGYAVGFEGLNGHVLESLPKREEITGALRKEVPVFPKRTIRELLANALIHQDLTITGAGPTVEIYPSRVEITNPGLPIVEPDRFIDCAPQSRNERFAFLMRKLRICEERGTGVKLVVHEAELAQLPAPLFATVNDATRVTLYTHRPLRSMGTEERRRACYQHAVVQFIRGDRLTNASLRKRLGIPAGEEYTASRVIQDAVRAGLIHASDPGNSSRKLAAYVPYWA